MLRLSLLLVALSVAASAQPATPLTVDGTTVGAPTAALPLFNSTPGACTLNPGAPEPYEATDFTTDTDGDHDVDVVEPISVSAGTDDTILLVYDTTFDPANACDNFVGIGNETAGSGLTVTLDDMTDYVLVVAGFFGTEDAYKVTVTGPAGSTVAEPPPLPSDLCGTYTYTSAVSFSDALTLSCDATVTAPAVTFESTIDGDGNGPWSLTVNSSGDTRFEDLIGETNPLASITTDAAGTTTFDDIDELVGVRTTGDQTYNDAALVIGAVRLAASGTLTFGSTVDDGGGGQLIAVGTDGVLFDGDVGGTTPLFSLQSTGGEATLTANTFETVRDIRFFNSVVVNPPGSGTTTFTVSGVGSAGEVIFGQTLRSVTDGEDAVVVSAHNTATFDGAVGGSGQRLAGLTVTALNGTAVNDLLNVDGVSALATNAAFDADASLAVEIEGTTAGVDYDQVQVTGTVDITGADLVVSLDGFTPTPGESFVILTNDGADAIVGTFDGLPEGAAVSAGSAGFALSYVGGDGNDIVLVVEPPPTFAKAFAPDEITTGATSTLTFTIDNSASAIAASSLDFTDNLPSGVLVAVGVNGRIAFCGPGTLTATGGASTISYSGGAVPASTTCTISVDVTSNTAGVHVNTSGDLTSSSGNSGPASDTITVLQGATITADLIVDTTADDQPYDAATSLAECTDRALDGDCTLREAILVANANTDATGPAGADLDLIGFEITEANGAAASGLATIQPGSALPAISDAGVTIDGTTQPGWAAATASAPATLTVELDGQNAGAVNGLTVVAEDVTVRGLVVNRFAGAGVSASTTGTGLAVEGSHIGTNVAGDAALGLGGNGVQAIGAANIRIGTDGDGENDVAERNVISGVTFTGVYVEDAPGVVIAGNYIGTNATGDGAVPNASGVYNRRSPNLRVGTDGSADAFNAAERNVISGNRNNGVVFEDATASGGVIAGNYIGTDALGTATVPNGTPGDFASGIGLFIFGNDTVIGGLGVDEGNLVSGNVNSGIQVNGNANTVVGNYVGTDVLGVAALPNGQEGIAVVSGSGNTIGGPATGEGNLVSGNVTAGVFVARAADTTVQGNLIGTDATGTTAIANQIGVHVREGSTGTLVGGTAAGAANTVSFNTEQGVLVVNDGTVRNAILGNAIFDNDGLGVDLGDDHVTENDPDDPDAGANDRQNYPEIVAAAETPTGADIAFTLDSQPGTYRVELFASATADPSGFGEGARFLGATTVTIVGTEDAPGALAVAGVVNGEVVTATATPITSAAGALTTTFGGTSEFSTAAPVLPAAAFAADAYTGVEGTSVDIVVTLTAPAQSGETVEVALTATDPLGADAGDLDGFTSETVTFATGQRSATVTIAVAADGVAEDIETFTLALRSPVGLSVGDPAETVLTVDPSAVSARFTAVQRAVSEGVGTVELVVELSDHAPAPATLEVRLTAGDSADLDGFTVATIEISSTPGAPTRFTVPVTVTDDQIVEADEQFVFTLAVVDGGESPGGNVVVAVGSPSATALVVVDNDGQRVVVTVPPRDADADGAEDGGPRAFAVPVGGLTAGEVAATASASRVYVLGPGGALVAVAPETPLRAGQAVVVDVAAGAELTFAGSAPAASIGYDVSTVGVDADGAADRVLVAVGNPMGRALALDAVAVEGGKLADVVLVFDAAAKAFRPVSLAGIGSGLARTSGGEAAVLGAFEVVVMQVVPTGDPAEVSVSFGTAAPGAAGAPISAAEFVPTDGETAVVLAFSATDDSAGDTVVLRFEVGTEGLDPFDGLDVTSPFGATLAAAGWEGDSDALFAALAGYDLMAGPATVPLEVAAPAAGAYELALVLPVTPVEGRPVVVEVLDGTVATVLESGVPFAISVSQGEDLTDRFAVRFSLGNAVASEDGPAGPSLAVYPNPSAGAATVVIPNGTWVRVAVYDALGREVAVLHDGPSAGDVRATVGRLTPGTYLVHAVRDGEPTNRRLTIAR